MAMIAYFILFCCIYNGAAIIPTFRILSGLDTSITSYPWMLSVRNWTGHHICGASLIRVNPNLTRSDLGISAAHCFRGHLTRGRPLRAYILAGTTIDTWNITTGEKRQIVEVQAYGYFPGDDALVLKLDSPLEFSDKIKPIDLPLQGKNLARNAQCFVTGWGLTQHSALQELPVTLQACNSKKFDYGSSFCAGGTSGSICSGDSGSPMVCRGDDGHMVQQGIVSYSDPTCGDFPATYSRVSFYIDWINTTIKKMSALQT